MSKAIVQTTTTTGYFNGNKHRLTINSNALRLNLTLEPGEFVRERLPDGKLGRQINDPKLDTFLQPSGLAKQMGDPVGLVLLSTESYLGTGITAQPYKPQPVPQPRVVSPTRQVQRLPSNITISDRSVPPKPALPSSVGSPGFSGGPIVKKLPPAVGITPANINPAVRAMSVKEAEEHGLIGRARRPIDGPPAENGLSAKDAPYADQLERPNRAVAVAVRVPQKVTITTPVGKDLPAPVLLTDEAPAGDIYAEDSVLEESTVGSPVATPLSLAVSSTTKPFVCAADGKSYSHYSSLSKYVHKTYPDRADELLAPYRANVNAVPGE